MASVFRTDTSANNTASSPATSLRVQTSLEGMPRTIGWGLTRVACNLIWYGDFKAVTVSDNSGAQGGKGGIFGAPAQAGSSYNYFASVELAVGEGTVSAIGPVMWASKARTTIVAAPGGVGPPSYSGLTVSASNFGTFLGDQAQMPWSYLSAQHPDQAFAYRLTAYLAGNVSLGSSAELPNWTFEVTWPFAYGVASGDADATLMIGDFLTNVNYGVPGWSAAWNADWTNARNYLFATGLLISYAMTEQTSASSFLQEVADSLNIIPVWSEATLKLVPRGDMLVAGNGHVYVPPAAPIYDFDDSHFLPNQSSFGGTSGDPVSGQQKAPREQNNIVKVEFLDRAGDYNSATVQAQDDGAILLYGERGSKGVKAWHWFQTSPAAQMAAQLALGREQVLNKFSFTVGPRFILPDVGDIVTITDVGLGLDRQWVRLLDMVENQDRSLNYLVEEYLEGTGASPLYGQQAGSGSRPNYNEDPGGINAPIIFEPTDELAGGLEVWVAISGVDPDLFGGYDAYISYDGATYSKVPGGRLFGSARMGTLTAQLPAAVENQTGQTIDEAHILSVNLSESDGELASGTTLDAVSLNTASWVDGEVVAYRTATLTGPNAYDLTYLVRGAYGTEAAIVNHQIGSPFVRIDSGILRVPFDQTRIGSTIYLKFLPFNIWGVTAVSLADVPSYPYKITGAALASPLPVVDKLRTVFEDGFQKIWWQEISDFRSGILYIVKKGITYQGAQTLAVQAHPPFVAFGAGNYWIEATCQPAAGLIVYSESPAEITIAGNMLTQNIVETIDFQLLGWDGVFDGVAKEGVDPTAVLRLDSANNILADPDVLNNPDVLNAGGIRPNGIWTSNQVIDVGYVADCSVNASWLTTGQPVGQDILSIQDILNAPDILAAGSAAFVSVWVEIRSATSSSNDLFEPGDIFGAGQPDMFLAGVQWSGWQRFVPGVYRAQYLQFRVVFESIDPLVIAYLLSFGLQISIPARIDNYLGNNVTVAGLTIVFMPDDAIASKPFNGGPLVAGIHNHPLPTISMDWQAHPTANYIIDALSLSQMTFHMVDGTGATVEVDGVNIHVEGY